MLLLLSIIVCYSSQARENYERLAEQQRYDTIDRKCWMQNMLLALDRSRNDVAKLQRALNCSDVRAKIICQPEMHAARRGALRRREIGSVIGATVVNTESFTSSSMCCNQGLERMLTEAGIL